ncbi:MAG TPA: pyridoxamine 5'-phosphate oxidase family protein [Streptosporangiaceae bacterium]|nr:pyridoxamine 5'-phosphate oxidase family protein [Streptosporangiaceae bacterium]
MSQTAAFTEVTSEAELSDLLGTPSRRAATKVRSRLHRQDRDWLAASPFCLVSTASADGTCDVSPKGDPPGFARVLDDTTIAIPDRPGNQRADGFRNILANPQVGVLFLIPGRSDTLRINGRARLIREAPFFDAMVVKGHRPDLALLVEVAEVFYHCPKAFMRSHLWQPQTWDPGALPSTACIVKAVQDTPESVQELEEYYGPSYAKRLYA